VLGAVVAFLRWALTEGGGGDDAWTVHGELVPVSSVPAPPRPATATPSSDGLELIDSAQPDAPTRYAWSVVTARATPRGVVLTGPYGVLSIPATALEPADVVLARLAAMSGQAPTAPAA